MARGPTSGGEPRIPTGPGALARVCATLSCRPAGAAPAGRVAHGPSPPYKAPPPQYQAGHRDWGPESC
eukprot:1179108-Lingulodinium_polyedra.AAC.1